MMNKYLDFLKFCGCEFVLTFNLGWKQVFWSISRLSHRSFDLRNSQVTCFDLINVNQYQYHVALRLHMYYKITSFYYLIEKLK